jgi:thiopurine S-methyltransferase
LTPAELNGVEAVYDRAALISWSEELRLPYALHLAGLTRGGTPLLLVTLEYPQSQRAGPPFSVRRDEVERLYSPHYTISEIARQDISQSDSNMRLRGVTELFEVCYRLRRHA